MGVPYAEVIGDPIAHSKSPLIHKFWLEKEGITGDYRAVRVTAAEVAKYLEARRADPDWRGCNVTMPLKRSVGQWLDRIDASSEWAGSINCVYWDGDELWGCNTDASGIAASIDHTKVFRNAAALIGSGAAANTAVWCLADEEVGEVRIVARNRDAADSLLSGMKVAGCSFDFEEAPEAFDNCPIVINATPLGMRGFPDLPPEVLAALRHSRVDATVFDMVYDPIDTNFLRTAATFGRRTVSGLEMLVAQARDSFTHFFPADPPGSASADRELMEVLTR